MSLTFSRLFQQRDVRETPSSTATATAVGLTAEPYVLVSAGGADLTAERVLTAGTGVAITDQGAGTTVTVASNDGQIVHDNLSGFAANEHINWTADQGATNIHAGNYTDTGDTTAHASFSQLDYASAGHTGFQATMSEGEGINISSNTISGEDASTTNKGIAKFSAGEGMDVSASAGTITYSGELATTTNKGIASFDTNHFGVSGGSVGLNNTVVNSINDNSTHRGSDGSDHSKVGANETAIALNTTHRGSDGSDHSLLANKTSYWSTPGIAFLSPSTELTTVRDPSHGILAQGVAGSGTYTAPVNLPHGAVVTSAVVYGSNTASSWYLKRKTHDGTSDGSNMATANVDTVDNTITNATIDNNIYAYFLAISLGSNESVHGAEIIYTTDYD